MASRLSWFFFGCACISTLLMIMPRVWNLRMLYVSAAERMRVQEEVIKLSESYGWLLSDLELLAVEPGGAITVRHRAHLRGPDSEQCIVFDLITSHPCDASF